MQSGIAPISHAPFIEHSIGRTRVAPPLRPPLDHGAMNHHDGAPVTSTKQPTQTTTGAAFSAAEAAKRAGAADLLVTSTPTTTSTKAGTVADPLDIGKGAGGLDDRVSDKRPHASARALEVRSARSFIGSRSNLDALAAYLRTQASTPSTAAPVEVADANSADTSTPVMTNDALAVPTGEVKPATSTTTSDGIVEVPVTDADEQGSTSVPTTGDEGAPTTSTISADLRAKLLEQTNRFLAQSTLQFDGSMLHEADSPLASAEVFFAALRSRESIDTTA